MENEFEFNVGLTIGYNQDMSFDTVSSVPAIESLCEGGCADLVSVNLLQAAKVQSAAFVDHESF